METLEDLKKAEHEAWSLFAAAKRDAYRVYEHKTGCDIDRCYAEWMAAAARLREAQKEARQ